MAREQHSDPELDGALEYVQSNLARKSYEGIADAVQQQIGAAAKDATSRAGAAASIVSAEVTAEVASEVAAEAASEAAAATAAEVASVGAMRRQG